MKCPKCGYLGFDSGDRCRNCGYDFSLISHPGSPGGRTTPPAAPGGSSSREPHVARGARYRRPPTVPADEGADRPLAGFAEGTPVDLPLFRGDACVLPPPRAPLAVRRATPTPTRIRPRTPAPPPGATPVRVAGDLDDRADVAASGVVPSAAARGAQPDGEAAPAGRRAAAAAIDLGLVAVIDLVVLHFTLAVCGLTFNDLHVLPALPMAGFLLLLNGGYVVLFTGTLGQTFGKMAAAIEVVPDRRERMDLRRAALRSAAMVVSLLPAGLGWLAALVGDHRGLHDRLAGTRVVLVADA